MAVSQDGAQVLEHNFQNIIRIVLCQQVKFLKNQEHVSTVDKKVTCQEIVQPRSNPMEEEVEAETEMRDRTDLKGIGMTTENKPRNKMNNLTGATMTINQVIKNLLQQHGEIQQ